jgi:methionyl-tRNA formyltransferase
MTLTCYLNSVYTPYRRLNKRLGFHTKDIRKETAAIFFTREDGVIDWSQTTDTIDRQVRALNPRPGCRTHWGETELSLLEGVSINQSQPSAAVGTVLRLDKKAGLIVQTGKGEYAVTRLQAAGKKELDYKSFMNGARGLIGATLC